MAISCLSILISGVIFVGFEIQKIGKQSLMYFRLGKITNSDLKPEEKTKKYDEVYATGGISLGVWIVQFSACIILSSLGVGILAWNFIIILIQKL